MKQLGFGTMRLPQVHEQVDLSETEKLFDRFLYRSMFFILEFYVWLLEYTAQIMITTAGFIHKRNFDISLTIWYYNSHIVLNGM